MCRSQNTSSRRLSLEEAPPSTEQFSQLVSLLPEVEGEVVMEEEAILSAAVDYIVRLRRQLEERAARGAGEACHSHRGGR